MKFSTLDPGQPLVQVTIYRISDTPVRFNCWEGRANEVLDTCQRGWWGGYQVTEAKITKRY